MIDRPIFFKIRKNKIILFFSLVLVLVIIFGLLRVQGSKTRPENLKNGQVQSIATQGPLSQKDKTAPTSTLSPTPNTPTPINQNKSQPQSQESMDISKLDLPNFESLSYQPTGQTKEEFLAKQRSLMEKIGSLQFERITTVQSGNTVAGRVIYKYQIKNSKTRTETPDASIIIARPEGCFRQKSGSDLFYKYKEGGPEKNCRMHASWSKYTAEEFEAMSDFKVLGIGSFEGKSATVVQFPDSIANTKFILKAWVSNENGLTLLVGGRQGDKKVTIEFQNYNFDEINNSVFEVPMEKVVETSELF